MPFYRLLACPVGRAHEHVRHRRCIRRLSRRVRGLPRSLALGVGQGICSVAVFAGGCRSDTPTYGVCGGREKLLNGLAGWWMGAEGVTIGVVEEVAGADEVDWKWFLRDNRSCHCACSCGCAWDKQSKYTCALQRFPEMWSLGLALLARVR
ncbi:hypothetical protein B9Z19DRAFT_482649 [Tuber borchii]|uniref:Uncharacterized protein n=1 Tax=Tuber borchii TaxID=42251 RepID=A0A2T6ZF54_TUBBO|nr:hypothetical protein B9Z19DRAFT_482649 [Tuber borchii]